jgi:hypothetical protein
MAICHIWLPANQAPATPQPVTRKMVRPNVYDEPATATKACRTPSDARLKLRPSSARQQPRPEHSEIAV